MLLQDCGVFWDHGIQVIGSDRLEMYIDCRFSSASMTLWYYPCSSQPQISKNSKREMADPDPSDLLFSLRKTIQCCKLFLNQLYPNLFCPREYAFVQLSFIRKRAFPWFHWPSRLPTRKEHLTILKHCRLLHQLNPL